MSMTTSGTATVTLPAETQILITREFDAPPQIVFRAWTTPELVSRWWTARRGEMTVCEIDLRVGGRWRYAMIANGGFEVAFHGEYREIVPGERLVSTEEFEGMPGAESLNTASFIPLDGGRRTRVELLVEHQEQAHRDAHIQSGMEDGLQDALDLLEQVAASLA